MASAFSTRSTHACFGGVQGYYEHDSSVIGLPMRFSVYQPPQAADHPVPVLFYLAGLTWIPVDYVRFLFNYIHTEVEGGPLAATVKPLSTAPVDKRKYSTDAFAIRASIDW